MEEEEYIGYKMDTKHTYKVYANEVNGRRFYKVQLKKKHHDGTEESFYRQLRFAKCKAPENGEIIRIKKGFEDLYTNSKDQYNPITVIVVMDYEIMPNKAKEDEKAYDKFQKILDENQSSNEFDDLPF